MNQQEIILQNKDNLSPEQVLEKLFDSNGLRQPSDLANVSITYREENGSKRGSFDTIHRKQLLDRQYLVHHLTVPNTIEIEFTDVVWDKRMMSCNIQKTYEIQQRTVLREDLPKTPAFSHLHHYVIMNTETNTPCESCSLRYSRKPLNTYRRQEDIRTRLSGKSIYKLYRITP